MTTDRDRETARTVMVQAPTLRNADAIADVIAAALAAERARVLAPVLAVAYASDDGSEYEHDHGIGDGHDQCPACWAEDIRRAAQDGES